MVCDHSKPVTILREGLACSDTILRASAGACGDGSNLNIAVVGAIGFLLTQEAADGVGFCCGITRTTSITVPFHQTLVCFLRDVPCDRSQLLHCG